MVYKLVLGDWSKDGHKQSEDFLFDCNYDVHKIRQAYKDSCKKLGITFNDGRDYTDNAGCLKDIEWRRVGCDYYINETQDCAKLIMNFIALSMPEDFTYKLTESEIEPINGYWNGELNAQLGYGLFFD